MDLKLSGRNVLVTGGSKGIGLACARAFVEEGARVIIVARNAETLAGAAQELGDVAYIAADLCDPVQAAAAVDEAERQLGPIDILVNSAGAAAAFRRTNCHPNATATRWTRSSSVTSTSSTR